MDKGLIACPNCDHEFELSDALTMKVREHLEVELQKDIVRRETELKKRQNALADQEGALAKQQNELDEVVATRLKEGIAEAELRAAQRIESQYSEQLNEMKETLDERENTLKELRDQERDLRKRQRELEDAKEAQDLEVSRALDRERDKLREEEARKFEDRYADQLKELTASLERQSSTIKELRQQEVDLRAKQRELEEAKDAVELEVARKLDEERAKIKEEAEKKFAEDHRLKDLEKEKVINDLRSSLDEAKRKAEQGSMETQGEVLELDFEAQLKAIFPFDDIQPVPKGVRGADLIHGVHTQAGIASGTLLWEMKNTKAWNAQWIPKLKEDMVEVRADLAILASVALPPDIDRFGQLDGVWVCDPTSAVPLATALREQLIAVYRERAASIDKGDKTELLYQYLAGNEFKQKIEGIVEAFTAMQDQINQERRVMEKHWKMRQKQVDRVIKNTVGLYGDMQGIIGGQIPTIQALELDDGEVKQLTDGEERISTDEADETQQ